MMKEMVFCMLLLFMLTGENCLRFDGPLGLSGMAIQFVTTYQFEPVGMDSTLFKVSIHAAGEVTEGLPAIVESVWEHFIFEQLQPYIKSGKHLEEK